MRTSKETREQRGRPGQVYEHQPMKNVVDEKMVVILEELDNVTRLDKQER